MPALRTWAGTGSAVAQADPCCPAVVAGLVALLRPVVGAELADLQHLVEEAGRLGSQCFAEEVALQWRLRTGLTRLHGAPLNGSLVEHLLHAWSEDSHHHLFERT
jgi:hypothetical protein